MSDLTVCSQDHLSNYSYDAPRKPRMQTTNSILQFSTVMYFFGHSGLHKYNQEVYDRIMILFDLLPIAGVLNNKFFCTHGGLSPELMKVNI